MSACSANVWHRRRLSGTPHGGMRRPIGHAFVPNKSVVAHHSCARQLVKSLFLHRAHLPPGIGIKPFHSRLTISLPAMQRLKLVAQAILSPVENHLNRSLTLPAQNGHVILISAF